MILFYRTQPSRALQTNNDYASCRPTIGHLADADSRLRLHNEHWSYCLTTGDREMKTVLVVEDDPNQGLLYEQELESQGYRVLRASDGREGIRMVQEEQPDCVVLDINMPAVNGLEAMSHILQEQPHLPVIINTAYSSYKDNFMNWAADAYVVKSSDLTELITRIEEVLSANTTELSALATTSTTKRKAGASSP
jgi:DNA-binding response OmpR family regulator